VRCDRRHGPRPIYYVHNNYSGRGQRPRHDWDRWDRRDGRRDRNDWERERRERNLRQFDRDGDGRPDLIQEGDRSDRDGWRSRERDRVRDDARDLRGSPTPPPPRREDAAPRPGDADGDGRPERGERYRRPVRQPRQEPEPSEERRRDVGEELRERAREQRDERRQMDDAIQAQRRASGRGTRSAAASANGMRPRSRRAPSGAWPSSSARRRARSAASPTSARRPVATAAASAGRATGATGADRPAARNARRGAAAREEHRLDRDRILRALKLSPAGHQAGGRDRTGDRREARARAR
jgi:hypothetical protein